MPGHRDGPLTRAPAAALAGLLLLGAGACGGGGASASAPSPAAAGPTVLTPPTPYPCSATAGLPLPQGWPARLPLPPGLVVTRTERRSGDRLITYGRVPGDFHDVVRFFNTSLPAAGLPQRNGQLDPFDAESDFAGGPVQGRWATGLSPECPGVASLTVLAAPAGGPAPTVSAIHPG